MELNPEVENEVVKESTSKKLEIIQVDPSRKVWKDSTQSKMTTSYLQIGESLW